MPLIGIFVHGGSFCLTQDTVGQLDAILDPWYPGLRGASAVADAVFGAFSPAGRTPVTWYFSDNALPRDRGDMSLYANASTGSPGLTYRFYEAPQDMPVVFSFGEGLTYSTFSVKGVDAPTNVSACEHLNISVTIANVGDVESDIVVTVFLLQQDVGFPNPISRLVTFSRLPAVEAGGERALRLPPITAAYRSIVKDEGAGSIYDVKGKRFGITARQALFCCVARRAQRASGRRYPFSVQQSSTQDLSTC